MALPRTFVGFSSKDIQSYWLMCAWKKQEDIDFNFANCQLATDLNSDKEQYIKAKCRERLEMAGTYLMLIGDNTRYKHKYVLWEAEVAIEKQCRIIGVNLDKSRLMNPATCPTILQHTDALFVPFSPHIVAYALENWRPPVPSTSSWYYYPDQLYRNLGFVMLGNIAVRPKKPNPFAKTAGSNR